MLKKNLEGNVIVVTCAMCKSKIEAINKEVAEEYCLDTDYGRAYFCKAHCKLKFCWEYDFDEEYNQTLIYLVKDRGIFPELKLLVLRKVEDQLNHKKLLKLDGGGQ